MKRKEVERILLAHAVDQGNIDFLVAEGIDPNYFSVYGEISEKMFNKAQSLGGKLPSSRIMESRFPNFNFEPPDSEVDAKDCLLDLKKFHAKDRFHKELTVLEKLTKSEDGWLEALNTLPNNLTSILSVLDTTKAIDFAQDSNQRYDYVLKRAEQRAEDNWRVNFAHRSMNDHFGGYEPGLYLYVARTGKGKTWTCLLDLWWTWFHGMSLDIPVNVGLFSLEMDKHKVGLRLDTFESHFSNYDLNRGIIRKSQDIEDQKDLEDQSREYIEYLERIRQESLDGKRGKFKIWTRDMFSGRITPRMIESLIRDEKLDFVVVDQLELVDADSKTVDERTKLNEVSLDFKKMSGRLEIPMLVPHQMNRETVKAKEVTDANVAGSDGPARHAEFVCYLTRDEITNVMHFNFLKSRNAPVDKKFALMWNWNIGHYEEVNPDEAAFQRLMAEDEQAIEEAENYMDERSEQVAAAGSW